MGKLIKKLTILATLLTFALGTIVYADDEEEYVPYDIPDEEKDLALYCKDGDIDNDGVEDEWIVLAYKDTTDGYGHNYNINVYYNNKPLSYYLDQNYSVEVRTDVASYNPTSWKIIDNNDIYGSTIEITNIFHAYTYQLRIKQDSNIISTSEYITLSDINSFAYPLSYSIDPAIDHLESNGKTSKIILKYSENLISNPTESPILKTSISYIEGNANFINPDYQFFSTNLKIDNHSEIINFNDIDYDWNYSLVSFYFNFAQFYKPYFLCTDLELENVYGSKSNAEPYHLAIFHKANSDEDFSTQKEAVIKDHRTNLSLSESTTLNVDILSDEVSADAITFVSSDDMIASVDENGLVTANSVGTAYIYAESKTSDEVYDYCIINVYDSNVLVPVSSIKLNTDCVTLQPGNETKLTATVLPENSIDKSVVWSSSDVNVAYVSQDGTVTAIAAGECAITCMSNYDNQVIATAHVIVSEPIVEVDKIEYEAPSKVTVGKKVKIKITVLPKNASRTDVKFSSSNTKYATVNSNGVVTTKKAGAGKTVTITISATDSSKLKVNYSFKIEPIKVTKVTLTASTTTVKVGKTAKITAKILPTNATNKNVKWKVSNTKYASISSKGILTAKKAGKTIKVTATTKDGSKKYGTIKIKIKK